MLDINDEVDALRGVGPSLSEKLSSQNIRKIEDLLFFLPIRYVDKTKLIKISDAIIDQKNLTQGKVIDSKILFFGRRALQVILDDGTERLKQAMGTMLLMQRNRNQPKRRSNRNYDTFCA